MCTCIKVEQAFREKCVPKKKITISLFRGEEQKFRDIKCSLFFRLSSKTCALARLTLCMFNMLIGVNALPGEPEKSLQFFKPSETANAKA